MARTVHVHLVDDLDGSRAGETVKFSLDGVDYQIDLNAAHADELRRLAAPYIVAGRRATRGIVTGQRPARATVTTSAGRARNHAIREWAARTGIDISGRGRIPANVMERFDRESAR